jgi:hypothetical protein
MNHLKFDIVMILFCSVYNERNGVFDVTAYHIEFDTNEMSPHIVAVKVTIERDVIRDMGASVNVALIDDPLWTALQRYVLGNSSANALKKALQEKKR